MEKTHFIKDIQHQILKNIEKEEIDPEEKEHEKELEELEKLEELDEKTQGNDDEI